MDINSSTPAQPKSFLRPGVFLKALWILEGASIIALVWWVIDISPGHFSLAAPFYFGTSLLTGVFVICLSLFIDRYFILEFTVLVMIFAGSVFIIPFFGSVLYLTHALTFAYGSSYDLSRNVVKSDTIELISYAVFYTILGIQFFLTRKAFPRALESQPGTRHILARSFNALLLIIALGAIIYTIVIPTIELAQVAQKGLVFKPSDIQSLKFSYPDLSMPFPAPLPPTPDRISAESYFPPGNYVVDMPVVSTSSIVLEAHYNTQASGTSNSVTITIYPNAKWAIYDAVHSEDSETAAAEGRFVGLVNLDVNYNNVIEEADAGLHNVTGYFWVSDNKEIHMIFNGSSEPSERWRLSSLLDKYPSCLPGLVGRAQSEWCGASTSTADFNSPNLVETSTQTSLPLTTASTTKSTTPAPVPPTPTPTPTNSLPFNLTSTPKSGAVDTTITLNGFGFSAKNNKVFFFATTAGGSPGSGAGIVLDNLPSSDGHTIYFTVPAKIGSCSVDTIPSCETANQPTPPGQYSITVLSGGGSGNALFTVTHP